MNIISNKIEGNFESKLPFVAYRKPNSVEVSGFFMNDDDLEFSSEINESGFVFAPFNSDEKAVIFSADKAEIINEKFNLNEELTLNISNSVVNSSDKLNHLKLVEKTIEEIKKNALKKVVVSRKEEIQLHKFDVLITFKKLLKTYTNAFVYVWFHPKVGLWLGATPETLLNISDNNFKTMSLAGTQVYKTNEKVIWKAKELDEQQLVTDFINNQLKNISSKLKIEKTETVKAGNLLHLRTKVEGVLNKEATLKQIIRGLHPTPAVCGLPREKAKDFILKNEHYNRTFYTGFLGELNIEKKSSLFVNLRCMDVKDKVATLYIGGGITKDSIPQKEWEETIAKSKTIKQVL